MGGFYVAPWCNGAGIDYVATWRSATAARRRFDELVEREARERAAEAAFAPAQEAAQDELFAAIDAVAAAEAEEAEALAALPRGSAVGEERARWRAARAATERARRAQELAKRRVALVELDLGLACA
ncbi:MAG: hypothetical protein R3F65_32525 [bacterium]